MNALFIAIPGLNSLDPIYKILQDTQLNVQPLGPDRLFVGDERDHVWVFMEADPTEVPESLTDAITSEDGVLVVEYSSKAFMHLVAQSLVRQPGSIVDDDHGVTLSGEEYMRQISAM
jgi:hypothetical protein